MSRDLLIELGTEELPPKALASLSAALTDEFVRQLDEAGLNHGNVERFAAPRRPVSYTHLTLPTICSV